MAKNDQFDQEESELKAIWIECHRKGMFPSDIPERPDIVYANEGWTNWHDWMLDQGVDMDDSNTKESVVKALADMTDYCYACIMTDKHGIDHICGFSRTFSGMQEVASCYRDVCEEEDIEGMTFHGKFERWSRNSFVQFLLGLKKNGTQWTYVLHGFIYEDTAIQIHTPDDIDDIIAQTDFHGQ
jgi:hypothetical protein